jgi:hypothetical protein
VQGTHSSSLLSGKTENKAMLKKYFAGFSKIFSCKTGPSMKNKALSFLRQFYPAAAQQKGAFEQPDTTLTYF